MTDKTPTRSKREAENISASLRSRACFLWIRTDEEARVEEYLISACGAAAYQPHLWDCAAGLCDSAGRPWDLDAIRLPAGVNFPNVPTDPGCVLDHIRDRANRRFKEGDGLYSDSDRNAWIARDLHKWLEGPVGVQTSRQLRNLARTLSGTVRPRAQAIIVITPMGVTIPPELAGQATVIDWPLPDREEIAALLDSAISGLPDEMKATAAPNGSRDAAIDAAVGLTGAEASACYAKSLVQERKVNPARVAAEKKRVIARDGLLQWMDPLAGGFDAVGGLDNVKQWVTSHLVAFSPRARAYGLPALKGIFLAGVSGCGKTYIAKAIATAFGNVPLIRLDTGAIKSKFVGESETNLRKAFDTIEACGRCVVLIDEVEKALAGATQGAADGGVSADALGALLTWMQERTSPAFIVATANDITGFATSNPEFLRRGRWDELFFVDLPTMRERVAILQAALATRGRKFDNGTDWNGLVSRMEGFSGAEIDSLVPEALFTAFADGEREPTPNDIALAASRVVPLSTTAKEKLDALRTWAKTRARPATSQEDARPSQAQATGRQLDF